MPTVASDTRGEPEPATKRRFVIVAAVDPARVLEMFEAPDWEPAIMAYVRKMREGAFKETASLRLAKPHEVQASDQTAPQ